MSTIHISRAFAKLGDDPLSDFAVGIFNGMSGNAAFATPPVTMPNLQTAQLLLHNSIAPAKLNGHAAVLAKLAAREDLILKLRTLAKYIEELPGMTEAVAATSNFVLVTPSSNRPTTPAIPVIKQVYNLVSTKLGLDVEVGSKFKLLEFRVSVDGKTWVLAATSTSTRNIVLPELLPGTLYIVQCRAGTGGKVFSEWSDPVSHMCT